MQLSTEKLKDFLIDSGLVSRKDITEAESSAGEKNVSIADALVSGGKISEEDLRRIESNLLGVPYVDLKNDKIDFAVLSIIPEPLARTHNIVAYKKTGTNLEVAMLDPQDLESIDFIKKSVGLKILPRLTDSQSVKHALSQYQQSLSAEFGNLIEKESLSVAQISESDAQSLDESDLKKMAEDIPIVRIVESLLSHAILQKASDIHTEPYENQVVIRYRIDGILRDAMTLGKQVGPGIVARIKVLASLRLDEKRLPQDGRFKIETPDQKVSFRVSTLPTQFGEKVVMRLLPEAVKGFTLESLGFHGDQLERIHTALKKTEGMILTTGPTGSGKTTTLYTMIDILNTPDVNISTIEDPVEYQMQRVNQTQIKPDIGLTFSSGIRTLVRQDPDIIMVGEIRDEETVSLAINASLTGHLVLSTLHTNSAAGAVPRLIEMGAEPFLLVSTIRVIIAQRLVRLLCTVKEKYTLSSAELKNLATYADIDHVLEALKAEKIVPSGALWSGISFYRPQASQSCEDGYHGRIGIYEVLPVTASVKELIMKSTTSDEITAAARKEGMLTMIEDGIFKAAQGLTSLEEVLRVVSE